MILRGGNEDFFNDTWDSLNQPNIHSTINMYKQWNNLLYFFSACATNGYITDIFGVDKAEVLLLNGSNYCHLHEANCDWKVRK